MYWGPSVNIRKSAEVQLTVVFTMRRNLLNWCNLVSDSEKVRFYVFWSGKNLLIANLLQTHCAK